MTPPISTRETKPSESASSCANTSCAQPTSVSLRLQLRRLLGGKESARCAGTCPRGRSWPRTCAQTARRRGPATPCPLPVASVGPLLRRSPSPATPQSPAPRSARQPHARLAPAPLHARAPQAAKHRGMQGTPRRSCPRTVRPTRAGAERKIVRVEEMGGARTLSVSYFSMSAWAACILSAWLTAAAARFCHARRRSGRSRERGGSTERQSRSR